MVDNLVGKVDGSTKSGLLSIVCIQLGPQKPLFRGYFSIEGESGLSELPITLWVSSVEGCRLTEAGFHCTVKYWEQVEQGHTYYKCASE